MSDIDLPYNRHDYNIKYDSDVFPREYNKLTNIGRLHQRKCLVKCNGDGKMSLTLEPTQTIDELHKLYKKGIITKSEFESKKKDLLDSIN